MSVFENLWTERARAEVTGCIEGVELVHGSGSEAMLKALPELLCFGEGGNKDRPLLWVAQAYILIARLSLENTISCYDLLWQTKGGLADQIETVLGSKQYASSELRWDPKPQILSQETPKARLYLRRLPLISGLASFIIAMNDYAFAEKFEGEVQVLTRPDLTTSDLRSIVNLWAQRLYAYRRDHMRAYDATQTARRLKAYFEEECRDQALDCEGILRYWEWDACPNRGFGSADEERVPKSYKAAVNQAFAYIDAVQDRKDAINFSEGSWKDYYDQSLTIVEHGDPQDLEDRSAALSFDFSMGDGGQLSFEVAAKGLVSSETLKVANHWLDLSDHYYRFGVTCLRLQAFDRVGNGLANALRTGKSKISLKDRLECAEAISYSKVLHNLELVLQELEAVKQACIEALPASLRKIPVQAGAIALLSAKKRDTIRSADVANLVGRVIAFNQTIQALRNINAAVLRLNLPFGSHEAQFDNDKMRFSARYTQMYGAPLS